MNPEHQKALLDELKIMIYIGRHINVLCLVGCVTRQMVKGRCLKLLIIILAVHSAFVNAVALVSEFALANYNRKYVNKFSFKIICNSLF